MSGRSASRHEFEVHSGAGVESDVLVAGFSEFGLAGLTAVDYIVDQFDLEQRGYVEAVSLPTITPFEEGRPRHPLRLMTSDDVPFTVLLSELLVPVTAAKSLSDSLLEWCDATGIEEIVVLSGVPVQHGPEDHRTFYVATDDYRTARLADEDVPAMGTGYLEGVSASLVADGIDTSRKVAVLVTPAHPQAPDADAALRLVDSFATIYDVDVDTGPLETFAADVQSHYRELAERLQAASQENVPEDRMYM